MNTFWNLIFKIRNFLLAVFQYKTVGARALIVKDGKALLIKHTYMPDWYTPGGGIDKGETPIAAVQRELMEEVGVKCLSAPKLFGIYYNYWLKRDDYVAFYIVEDFERRESNSPEIAEIQWFDLNNLPDDAAPSTKSRIAEYLGTMDKTEIW
jgi:mutator protein MutT